MAAKLLLPCLLLASQALARPQTLLTARQAAIGSHSSQTVRSPFGQTLSSHSKTVTDLDGTAHVHRFDSRLHNNVVRVARPRLVTSGPFAVQALPHHTPIVVGGGASTPVITASRTASSNLFQTPDGRVFAFSNGQDQILPGQIFQTPDGRIFTTAVLNNQPTTQEAIQASRDATPEPQEEEEEVVEVIEEAEEPVEEPNQRTQQQQQQEVVVTQSGSGLPSFVAVPQRTTVLARAPLTPATSRFVATPVVAHHGHAVVAHDNHVVVPSAATPAVVRASATPIAAQATPVGFSLADTVSTGFFTFPGAGVAFNF